MRSQYLESKNPPRIQSSSSYTRGGRAPKGHRRRSNKAFTAVHSSFAAPTVTRELATLYKVPEAGLTKAVMALQNNRILRTTEVKGAASVEVTYPPELVAGLRAMFPAGKVYNFLLHISSTQAATGGGVVAGYMAWNATSSYGEWTALAALFDECKMVASHLTWTTAFGAASTGIITQIALAPDFVSNAVTPSFTPITRLAESREFGIEVPGKGGSATALFTTKIPPGRQWAITASPTSSTLDCGMNGQWSFASNIVTTPSINFAFLVMRNTVKFRCRA